MSATESDSMGAYLLKFVRACRWLAYQFLVMNRLAISHRRRNKQGDRSQLSYISPYFSFCFSLYNLSFLYLT